MKSLASLETDFLFNHPQLCEVLAEWHYSEWGRSTGTLSDSIKFLDESKSANSLPLVIVALRETFPVGMAMLVQHDISSRKDLTPWLSALYVPTKERNKGVGSFLVARVVAEARRLEYEQIYLFTVDKIGFYSNLEWQVSEILPYRNSSVAIMVKSLMNLGERTEVDWQ